MEEQKKLVPYQKWKWVTQVNQLDESTTNFLSQLSYEEKLVIKKQITTWRIDKEDMDIIKKSQFDINWFLSECEDFSELEKKLIINRVENIVIETRLKVLDILEGWAAPELNLITREL